jgi:hypothetical protein
MRSRRQKLSIHRDTLRRLDAVALRGARGALAGTLTQEGGCNSNDTCGTATGTGGTSTVECTQINRLA